MPLAPTIPASLRSIASRIRRNVPQHRDEQGFHDERYALEADVLELAREIEAAKSGVAG